MEFLKTSHDRFLMLQGVYNRLFLSGTQARTLFLILQRSNYHLI
uniref:Uncharacterized protein n=1 Tax=Siphoviridae sp. ctmAU6 TaxID=2826451 RepID=A0A8S5MFN2_9CAUD|nr:MAG TPA: hypothetical protein [Siphoviridae sp. ctmAU6]